MVINNSSRSTRDGIHPPNKTRFQTKQKTNKPSRDSKSFRSDQINNDTQTIFNLKSMLKIPSKVSQVKKPFDFVGFSLFFLNETHLL